jgi:hypothetical protein
MLEHYHNSSLIGIILTILAGELQKNNKINRFESKILMYCYLGLSALSMLNLALN